LFFQINHFTYNRKSRIALNKHKNKHSLRSNTKGYDGKLTKLAHKIAASPETFRCTLVCVRVVLYCAVPLGRGISTGQSHFQSTCYH
jgi:hypothetical protein